MACWKLTLPRRTPFKPMYAEIDRCCLATVHALRGAGIPRSMGSHAPARVLSFRSAPERCRLIRWATQHTLLASPLRPLFALCRPLAEEVRRGIMGGAIG